MVERFWAKTGAGDIQANGTPKYHPVICHLADTAAVAMEIVREYLSPAAIAVLEKSLGIQGDALIRCCGFLAGCHDLGKVSPAFQFQVSDVGRALVGEHFYDLWLKLPDIKTPHGLVTAKTMPEFLYDAGLGNHLSEGKARRLARRLATIVGGHHGFFPTQAEINALNEKLCGTEEWSDWRNRRFSQTIFEQLQSFVGLVASDFPTHCDNAAVMILAGLTTVSDWIASNPDEDGGFPYADDMPFDEYQVKLFAKARNALKKIGWTKVSTGQPLDFGKLFPQITKPRPLQKAAIVLSKSLTPPCLVLFEASMGEGKTEAALYLTDYLQHQASAGGFYIGLPTQATSNAMWERVKDFLGKRYPKDVVNLTLSHSAASLRESYQQTVCRLDQVYDKDNQNSEGKIGAGEWHTVRKRTLLSPYGVGTVDQGLMGIVRSKHQFVRLFGLAGRTVILDEIHAYDWYTSTLLERFLEWLAVLGSPVIALSATLPTSTRNQLVSAYARGCGYSNVEVSQTAYPRLTAFTAGQVLVNPFSASDHVCRSLDLHWIDDEEWRGALRQKLEKGGCAAVICSTVGRAQEVFHQLQSYFAEDELGLFHGRFLFTDRERIEKECLKMFGKDSQSRPKRYVLVATQVIEQSLDVDFDLMISDLAPIDLLLQRSGRLHRHERDRLSQLKEPTLWIFKPKIDSEGKAQFAETGLVYHRHVLLRSWLALRHKHQLRLPDETDTLIESVYHLDAPSPDDLELVHRSDWATSLEDYQQGETFKKRDQASAVILPPAFEESCPEKFTRQGEADDDSTISQVTRLGDPTVTTIFLQRTTEGLTLPGQSTVINLTQPPNLAQIKDLLAHSARIGKRGLVEALLAQKNPSSWTSALLKYCRYLELNAQGQVQVDRWQIEIDPKRGVVITKANSGE
jgi:CRISPR-associated endonuclease/helicase Cas3